MILCSDLIRFPSKYLKGHRQPVSFARLCFYYPGNQIGRFASETRVREKRDDGRKSFRYHGE